MSCTTIFPTSVSGTVKAPASKSMMQRAVMASLLAKEGISELYGFMDCNDSLAALSVAEQLGAKIERTDSTLVVKGGLADLPQHLRCGESGLLARMVSPIAATLSSPITIEGEGSLSVRPFSFVKDTLRKLGVRCTSNGGLLPLQLQGPLQGGAITVDGSISSQLITGLLLALPLCKSSSTLNVNQLNSRPYIDMTIDLLSDFGVEVENDSYETFYIKANQQYKARRYTIEGDWSGGSCLLVAGAIGGSICVEGLKMNSLQADRKILDALAAAGASVEVENNALIVTKQRLDAFDFDATQCPDLFPALVVLASACEGISRIKGAKRLKHKESDRASALKQEFAKLGVQIHVLGNVMEIIGGKVTGGKTFAHNDHRIAMALAVAASIADSPIEIEGIECVAKSYPQFFSDFSSIQHDSKR